MPFFQQLWSQTQKKTKTEWTTVPTELQTSFVLVKKLDRDWFGKNGLQTIHKLFNYTRKLFYKCIPTLKAGTHVQTKPFLIVCECFAYQMHVHMGGTANMHYAICIQFVYHSPQAEICQLLHEHKRELCTPCRQIFLCSQTAHLLLMFLYFFPICTGQCSSSACWNHG